MSEAGCYVAALQGHAPAAPRAFHGWRRAALPAATRLHRCCSAMTRTCAGSSVPEGTSGCSAGRHAPASPLLLALACAIRARWHGGAARAPGPMARSNGCAQPASSLLRASAGSVAPGCSAGHHAPASPLRRTLACAARSSGPAARSNARARPRVAADPRLRALGGVALLCRPPRGRAAAAPQGCAPAPARAFQGARRATPR